MMKKLNSRMKHPLLTAIMDYIYVLVGSAIVAISFNIFLLPTKVASGGVSGISTITYTLFGWEPAFVQWSFNIPLFIAGVILLGKQFGLKTAVGTVFFPFVVFLTNGWSPATTDPLLGALFGGIGVAVGFLIFQQKKRSGILMVKLACDVLWAIHFLLLQAYTGVALSVVAATREILW